MAKDSTKSEHYLPLPENDPLYWDTGGRDEGMRAMGEEYPRLARGIAAARDLAMRAMENHPAATAMEQAQDLLPDWHPVNVGPEIFNRQTEAASELIDKWWGPGLTSEPGQAWLDIMPFTEQMENPDPQAVRRALAAQSLRSARRAYGPHDKAPLPAGGTKPWHNEARGMVHPDMWTDDRPMPSSREEAAAYLARRMVAQGVVGIPDVEMVSMWTVSPGDYGYEVGIPWRGSGEMRLYGEY